MYQPIWVGRPPGWDPRRKEWPVGQVVKTAASHAVNIGSNPVRVTIPKKRCFFGNRKLDNLIKVCYCVRAVAIQQLVLIRARVHPFPSRTRKLSSLLPTILGWRRPGKIGSANTKSRHSFECLLFCISLFGFNAPVEIVIRKYRGKFTRKGTL